MHFSFREEPQSYKSYKKQKTEKVLSRQKALITSVIESSLSDHHKRVLLVQMQFLIKEMTLIQP